MQYGRQIRPVCSVSASFTIYRSQNAAKSLPQRVTHNHRVLLAFSVINSPFRQVSPVTLLSAFFLGVHALAAVLRDNPGTGILSFPPPLKPAPVRAAIPRTSNSLQDCNSSAHRN